MREASKEREVNLYKNMGKGGEEGVGWVRTACRRVVNQTQATAI